MSAMDEKIPGVGGTSTNPAPPGGEAGLMQFFQQLLAKSGAPAQGALPSTPAMPGMALGAPAVPNVGGMSVAPPAMLPSGTPVAENAQQAAYPGPFPQRMPQPDMAQVFATKGQRDTFMVQSAIQGVGEGVRQFKQQKFEEESNQTAQAWQNYLYFKKGADAGDPKAKEMMDQMMSDPKIHKLFDKAQKDLNDGKVTGAAVGLQRAIKSSKDEAASSLAMAHVMSQIQAQQAQAARDQAEQQKAQALTPREGQERDIAMGVAPSADVKEAAAQRAAKAKEDIDFKYTALQENIKAATERAKEAQATARDRIEAMREATAARTEMTRMRIDAQAEKAAEKSKIPSVLINRAVQADTIKNQITQLEGLVQDPSVRKYIGPGIGMGAGLARKWNDKLSEAIQAHGSLMNMQPILHGYRGAASVTKEFQNASGGFSQKPESYERSLKAMKGVANGYLKELKAHYPNDPFWADKEIGASVEEMPEFGGVAPGTEHGTATSPAAGKVVIHKMD